MSNQTKRIAFVGGGSGGHIQPIASLIDYAEQYTNLPTQSKRYRFGQAGGLEQVYADKYESVQFIPIATGKLRRYWTLHSTLQNIRDIFLVLLGFFQSVWLLKKHRINVIFCKGGFVCPPVAYASWIWGIPVMMHESDTHLGLANRLTLPVAKSVFTGFGGVREDEQIVGQILSPNLLRISDFELEGLDSKKTTVLVMGGSQGAQILFDTVYEIVTQGDHDDIQYVFLLGTKNQGGKNYTISGQIWTVGYVDQATMGVLYILCDLSITRGSASSLQEQHCYSIRKAIVPLPYTGGDHQTTNAHYYQEQYDDVWVPQDEQLKHKIEQFVSENKDSKKEQKTPTVDELCHASVVIWEEIMKNNRG